MKNGKKASSLSTTEKLWVFEYENSSELSTMEKNLWCFYMKKAALAKLDDEKCSLANVRETGGYSGKLAVNETETMRNEV